MEKILPNTRDYNYKDLFSILQQVMMDAYRADAFLFEYPYENLERIDRGFRKTIWDQYDQRESVMTDLGIIAGQYELVIMQSTLGFYNLIAYLTTDEHPAMLSIGPFRNEEINIAFLQRIINENKLTNSQLSTIRQFYQALPLINPDDIATTALHLIELFIPEFKNTEIKKVSFTKNSRKFEVSNERLDALSVEYAKTYSDHMHHVIEAVASGNTTDSMRCASSLINFLGVEQSTSLSVLKKVCSGLNVLLYQAAIDNGVHPIYALRQFTYFDSQLDNSASVRFFQHMPYDLVHKYTILIKNYSYKEYSYLVRNIRNYVDLHLEEELSLQVVADQFNKNASYISALFKNEMGQTLTDYIQLERIRAAMSYLNSSDMSIAEIAGLVGFTDFGYFTKVFKKHIGHSPSEYRKMMKK